MIWFVVNWYIVVAVVSAFLLGWAIGISIGATKGYDAAIQDQQERASQELWSNYINQFKGGYKDEEQEQKQEQD